MLPSISDAQPAAVGPLATRPPGPGASPRRPWVAGLLGILQPGLGHAYAGELRRGLVLYGMLSAVRIVVIWIVLEARPGALLVAAFVIPTFLYAGTVVDAFLVARRAPKQFRPKPYNRWYAYIAMLAVAWLVEIGVSNLQDSFVKSFRLPSGAMAPTLLPGDWIFVDNRAPASARIDRGTIVTYQPPGDSLEHVKRIVGMPGDSLAMRNDTLIRNGRIVDEPYAALAPLPDEPTGPNEVRTWGPFVVPGDHVFILGDNRHSSLDSRFFGPVPMDVIRGTVRFIYYSHDPASDRRFPAITAVRWERLGRAPR